MGKVYGERVIQYQVSQKYQAFLPVSNFFSFPRNYKDPCMTFSLGSYTCYALIFVPGDVWVLRMELGTSACRTLHSFELSFHAYLTLVFPGTCTSLKYC